MIKGYDRKISENAADFGKENAADRFTADLWESKALLLGQTEQIKPRHFVSCAKKQKHNAVGIDEAKYYPI
jgi:hypothetical protein